MPGDALLRAGIPGCVLPCDLSNEELEHKILYDCHLWLDMGYIFGKEGEGFLRFNLACPRETLEKGLRQLKEGFEK